MSLFGMTRRMAKRAKHRERVRLINHVKSRLCEYGSWHVYDKVVARWFARKGFYVTTATFYRGYKISVDGKRADDN